MHARSIPVQRRLAPLDPAQRRRHKLRNLAQSAVLLGGMVVLLGVLGFALFGGDGLIGMGLGAALALAFSPKVSPAMVLRLYGVSPLDRSQIPAVFDVLGRLAERADLRQAPQLYYVPSAMLNAFAVGRRDDAVIALTDGLLRTLSLRELAGVLAHEISHVRNNDLWLMGLADTVGRLTRLMAMLGTILLIVILPLWATGQASLPWLFLLLLLLAPQITELLQLALSRAREFDADLDAAGLTQDPAGLASALLKLERHQRGLWEQILLPGYRQRQPSALRSHPPTEQRVARLESLYAVAEPTTGPDRDAQPIECPWARIAGPPRARLVGYWH
jgi:heat shock protein HtpX